MFANRVERATQSENKCAGSKAGQKRSVNNDKPENKTNDEIAIENHEETIKETGDASL